LEVNPAGETSGRFETTAGAASGVGDIKYRFRKKTTLADSQAKRTIIELQLEMYAGSCNTDLIKGGSAFRGGWKELQEKTGEVSSR